MGSRRRRLSYVHVSLIACLFFTVIGLLILTLRSLDDLSTNAQDFTLQKQRYDDDVASKNSSSRQGGCATVEEMGHAFRDGSRDDTLRVRTLLQLHFALNGASRVRGLAPEEFCRHGYVIGKASEAGFGNEMYKILTAAALSVMLNRSLIIGQTRGNYPFGDYISYSEDSFTLKEVKHLWRKNGCLTKYGRHLVMRIDDFQKPAQTGVLCDNWMEWEQPIIWFQNTTDAVAAQFFLKNVHDDMRKAASNLFGLPKDVENRPNVYGELMRVLISPSESVKEAVSWVIGDGEAPPDITLHMRMLMNRSVRAVNAALNCIRKAAESLKSRRKPKIVLVSDTPSLINDVTPILNEFAEVVHFDYKLYKGNISSKGGSNGLGFRVKDWGPAPRWVAFVDFFLASRAKHAVVSGAHRRVGTTYAQLIAAMSAAHNLEEKSSTSSNFSFLSSFQSNLLSEGLENQVGWGHVWNRFAGPLSCRGQSDQCAITPLLSPAWWDGLWQSPISRDIRRMQAYGIQLSGFVFLDTGQKMYKNQLQELAQRSCFNLPCYVCVREGPDHAPRFKASVNFNGETFQCPFYSTTIRQAEHAAAQAALTSLSSRCSSKSLTARVLDESGIYKNLLQETAHRAGMKLPIYTTVRSGPGHVPVFTSRVEISSISFEGESAKTKKQAEKNAAIAAWSALKTKSNLGSLSPSIKETNTREELDQAIVTRVLSNLRPKDESKLVKRGDPNQAKRSLFMARGNKDTNFSTNREQLLSCVSKSLAPTPKPYSFPKTVSSPPNPIRPIGKSMVKVEEYRGDENEWLGGTLKGEITTLSSKFCNQSRVSGSSSFGEITSLDHWIYGEVTHGGYNPRELTSLAPAVQVRSVIPVCASPPLLRRPPTTSSYPHPQPVRSALSTSSSASLMSKYKGN